MHRGSLLRRTRRPRLWLPYQTLLLLVWPDRPFELQLRRPLLSCAIEFVCPGNAASGAGRRGLPASQALCRLAGELAPPTGSATFPWATITIEVRQGNQTPSLVV